MLLKYDHLLKEFGNKNYATPMEKDIKLRKFEANMMFDSQREYVERFPYQNIVGALLYLSINTRPDISYAVGVLARFSKNPNYRACKALLRVLIYLQQLAGKMLVELGMMMKLREHSFPADRQEDIDGAAALFDQLVIDPRLSELWHSRFGEKAKQISTLVSTITTKQEADTSKIWKVRDHVEALEKAGVLTRNGIRGKKDQLQQLLYAMQEVGLAAQVPWGYISESESEGGRERGGESGGEGGGLYG